MTIDGVREEEVSDGRWSCERYDVSLSGIHRWTIGRCLSLLFGRCQGILDFCIRIADIIRRRGWEIFLQGNLIERYPVPINAQA